MTLRAGLYDPMYEHDACGLGFVARLDGRRTRETVEEGLEVLHNLEHRGTTGSDPETGDGAGILTQIPDGFFRRACAGLGIELPAEGRYAVGMLFEFGQYEVLAAEERLAQICAEEGQDFLGFRDVPTNPEAAGKDARSVMPRIRQFFVGSRAADGGAFERKLYVIRRRLHKAVEESHACYVVSLSSRTVIYKGLLKGQQLSRFYTDLGDPNFASAISLVHERFSTNTLGSWELAHPYRYVAHNGEINTIRGNVNWMRARENRFESELFGEDLKKISPVIQPGQSDSASLDNALEILHLAGRSLPHAVAMMIPEAWENDDLMAEDRRAFYRYHSALMETWDGPAAVAFTDGRLVGATLDRNGLRPARYSVTRDGRVIMASEDGALRVPAEDVIERWRLQPGKMLVVDTERRELLHDEDVKRPLFVRQPYGEWLEEGEIHLNAMPEAPVYGRPESASLFERQLAFGYTMEDLRVLLSPMAQNGKEPDGSMGTDTPLAVLSERPQLLFNYFKQHFAQVTNPPIDPLREELVMSLKMSLGPEQNLFDETPKHCRRVLIDQPVLTASELEKIRALGDERASTTTLSTLFSVADGEGGLEKAVGRLCEKAESAVRGGSAVLVLSDRGVNETQAPIPSLLATASVHHHLVRAGIRTATTLVVETAEAREVHHFALLVGYGATAINPYLAFETVEDMARSGLLEGVEPKEASKNFIKAIGKGLLKVLSKMGISTLFSYCGAQIFEAVGLDQRVINEHFTGTASRVGGVGLDEIGREVIERHRRAFAFVEDNAGELEIGGEYQLRMQGQYHQWNQESIPPLQRAVKTEDFETFKEFTRHFDEQGARFATLRGLFEFDGDPIPVEEVEPASEIVKRFTTGAMSLGSISKEAHETLAIAMNRIGGKSNTGEGGEDPARFTPDPNGDNRRSAIKQVASGRFGVTTEYLVNADQLQIKMAQGSKPGEGGQLPGHKISEYIAKIRYSTPGVGLISPPPHHDIYSIEDLAQLIHDLKNANPRARVSVKLVAEVGVGTVAAGVSKARADHITISGHDGGTGASPLSSIKHAGLPWELGIAETQQVLVENGLRGRVILQTDGQLKTGRDVVVAALLGAEDFAFSTAPLVATGCIMMRVCHLNTCPGRHRHPGPGAQEALHRHAGARHQLLLLRRRRGARVHGRDGLPALRGHDRARRQAEDAGGHRALEGQGRGPLGPPAPGRGARRRRHPARRSPGAQPRQGAGQRAYREVSARPRSQGACPFLPAHHQHEPHGRGDALGGDSPALRRRGTAGRHDPDRPRGCRGPVVRRVDGEGPHPVAAGHDERLRRQGPLGWPARRLPIPRGGLRSRPLHRGRQRCPLRRDERRGVLQWLRRGALRGAQLGGRGGRRGHRRPRLRVHDRRGRGRARADRPQLRGRHERRRRVRPGRGGAPRAAVQPGDGWPRSRRVRRRRRALARHGPQAPGVDRQRGGAAGARRLGGNVAQVRQGHAQRPQARDPERQESELEVAS